MSRFRWIITATVGIVGIGCLVIALRPVEDGRWAASGATGRAGETGGGQPAEAAPLWSARRTPGPLVDAVGVAQLRTRLADIAAGSDACYRVEINRLGVVADSGGPVVIPASTEKLMTAAGALAVLGPEFTFVTETVAPAPPVAGRIEHLWLVGGGDPVLSTPAWIRDLSGRSFYVGLTASLTPLSVLADEIVAAGVLAIPGGIVGDASRYTTPRYVASWPASYRAEVGPLGALVVDDGFDAAGAPVADPALAAAEALTTLLIERGVTVGPASTGEASDGATPIAGLSSAPLNALVTTMLSASDNGTAEALALAVDAATGGPGTTEGGTAEILRQLGDLGVDVADVVLADASGLSRDNRSTCPALLQTLQLGADAKLRTVVDGAAIAAERGTLRARFVDTASAGRLYAKTGSLNGVAGLVGLFDPRGGAGTPRFAAVFNGSFGNGAGIGRTSAAADAVAAFPESPPAGELVPAP